MKDLYFAEPSDLLRSGQKEITIRRGKRDFEKGEAVLGKCADGSRFLLKIRSCKVKRAYQVTKQEAKDDGYKSLSAMMEDLRTDYPNLSWEDEVSVVRFEALAEVKDE